MDATIVSLLLPHSLSLPLFSSRLTLSLWKYTFELCRSIDAHWYANQVLICWTAFFRVNQCIQYKMHPSNIIAYIKIMGLLHWNNMACIRFHWANISISEPNQRTHIYLTAFISNECWNLSFEHGNLCARRLQFIRFLLTLRMHFHAAYSDGGIVQKIQFSMDSNGNFIENRWHLDRILATII